MSELQLTGDGSPFDAIRRVTPEGREYWSARELMPLLGYEKWERFADAIDRAKIAAHNSGYVVAEQFPASGKKVELGSGAQRTLHDFPVSDERQSQVIRLRLEHPDWPLSRIGEEMDPPASKDTVSALLRRARIRGNELLKVAS